MLDATRANERFTAPSSEQGGFVRRLDYVLGGGEDGRLNGPVYYALDGEQAQAWTVGTDGKRSYFALEITQIGNRLSTNMNGYVRVNGADDVRYDVTVLEWDPKTITDKTVKVTTYHGGGTPNGLNLAEASAAKNPDVDGDGKADVIHVQTSAHPFIRRSEEHPDGIDYSRTLPEPKTRIEVIHSNIGVKVGK